MKPLISEIDRLKMIDYINSDGWYTEHLRTREFEEIIAGHTGLANAIAVNNGTISLTLILLALGIGHGDEYIVPNYTMIATANSGIILGAKPIFCDVEFPSLYIDISLVEEKITDRTKALILVNANGRYPSYPIEKLIEICNKHNIYLIEDTAQGLGSYYPDGSHLGTKGIASSISFSMPKIITTGQGGMILTNDNSLADKIKKIKDFGRSGGGLDIHNSIGYNFKFTDIQACLGIAQMTQLQSRIETKKLIYNKYLKNLKPYFNENFLLIENDVNFTAPWFFELLIDRRDELQLFLKTKGIQTRVMYPPINSQIAFQINGEFPISELIGKGGLWLPSYVQITDAEIDYICENIINFLSEN